MIIADKISPRPLDELTKGTAITKRALTARFGIAIGLVNAYIYIKEALQNGVYEDQRLH